MASSAAAAAAFSWRACSAWANALRAQRVTPSTAIVRSIQDGGLTVNRARRRALQQTRAVEGTSKLKETQRTMRALAGVVPVPAAHDPHHLRNFVASRTPPTLHLRRACDVPTEAMPTTPLRTTRPTSRAMPPGFSRLLVRVGLPPTGSTQQRFAAQSSTKVRGALSAELRARLEVKIGRLPMAAALTSRAAREAAIAISPKLRPSSDRPRRRCSHAASCLYYSILSAATQAKCSSRRSSTYASKSFLPCSATARRFVRARARRPRCDRRRIKAQRPPLQARRRPHGRRRLPAGMPAAAPSAGHPAARVRRQAEEARRHAARGCACCWAGWCRHPLLCAGALRREELETNVAFRFSVTATDGRYDQIVGDEIPDRP